jgi:uncharacterized protein (TIGR02246 family)
VSFDETLRAHLRAVEGRDLEGFVRTVADDAVVILPNGKVVAGRDAIEAFHRDWFADPDWSFEAAVERTVETPGMALAVTRVHYRDVDPGGAPYERTYHLGLVFVLRDGAWLLVHDQNTFI